MNTNNPLGQRPFQQMGLAGDFDFAGAPVPQRVAPELLAGNAIKEAWIHPPAIVQENASPWDADQSVMMLGAGAVTSTQTVVPSTDTTPATAGAIGSGQPVWSAWFSESSVIPGIPNWGLVLGVAVGVALLGQVKKNPRLMYRRTPLEQELARHSHRMLKKGRPLSAAEYRGAARWAR
jgi:hypothetical protein